MPRRSERRTRQIGRELFERIGRGPSPWHRAWWDDRLMTWSLNDSQVRVQLFRFIDALPSLRSADSVRRHLAEYLAEAGEHVPWWLKLAVALAPAGSDRETLLAWSARSAARGDGAKIHRRRHARRGHQDGSGPARQVAGLHGRPPGRGGDQRRRGRSLPADLPGPHPRARRSPEEGPGSPADRPRSERADSAGQPLTQAVELDHPFRPDPCRGHAHECGRPAAADSSNGPRAERLCSC